MTDTTSANLAEWLLEQIAEDERALRSWDGSCFHIEACDDGWEAFSERYPADRLLAECEAKRQIIKAVQRREQGHPGHHANVIGDPPGHYDPYDSCAYCLRWNETTLGSYALRLLALPHADRPGYRPEWRPE